LQSANNFAQNLTAARKIKTNLTSPMNESMTGGKA